MQRAISPHDLYRRRASTMNFFRDKGLKKEGEGNDKLNGTDEKLVDKEEAYLDSYGLFLFGEPIAAELYDVE